MKINIDPQKKLFRWGPIDGKLIYPEFFNQAFIRYAQRFYAWPDIFGYFRKEKMLYILDRKELYDSGEINFKRYILNDKNFKKYYQEWKDVLKKALTYNKIITKQNLRDATNNELKHFFTTWTKLYLDLWTVGLIPEIANWGGEELLKRKLEKKCSHKDFLHLYERLTAPEDLSFYQLAELKLLKLKPNPTQKRLEKHQKEHFHLMNSYHHTRVLNVEYFNEELAKFSLQKAKKTIKELEELGEKVRAEKIKLIKKHKLGREIEKIAKRLSFSIWWQDHRKLYIFLSNHYIDLFLKEFARRYNLKFNELCFYNYLELMQLVKKGKKNTASEMKKRHAHMLVYYQEKANKISYASGAQAKKLVQSYLTSKVNKKVEHFSGLVVSQGAKYKAKVKILYSAEEVGRLKKGEILVAPMTSPEYITAIKKAGALITDEGGMTCHAAIVSREMKIPCIVGTRIATKVLKNNQLVEIDPKKGIVKII